MLQPKNYEEALEIVASHTVIVGTEKIPLSKSYSRVLAEDVVAQMDVPSFDRSPFDGYALLCSDTANASKSSPVTLRILEEVKAGEYPAATVVSGTAVKILTGSPLPKGADCIVKYEETKFTEESVTIFRPVTARNIVQKGEDVKKGTLIAKKGDRIDAATMGTLAAQGIVEPMVYKIPKVGIISTGDELVEMDEDVPLGKIRNTNRYMLEGAIRSLGAEPVVLGTARDDAREIAALFEAGASTCDFIISTGGAALGDYDETPEAMNLAGFEILVRGVRLKPGGACAYAKKGNVLAFCLSGNPASSMVNFHAVVSSCIRKATGLTEYKNKEVTVTLAQDYNKKSPKTRLIRGQLDLSSGQAVMHFKGQGNAMLHSAIGCDVLAVVPAGSDEIPAGTKLRAYLI